MAARAPTFFPPRAGAQGEPAAAPSTALTGVVREVIQVTSYTYLRITTADSADQWAAIEANPTVAVGDTVSVVRASLMQNFESKTLGRTFATIYFGALGSKDTAGL